LRPFLTLGHLPDRPLKVRGLLQSRFVFSSEEKVIDRIP
jgi:hypothetical protein